MINPTIRNATKQDVSQMSEVVRLSIRHSNHDYSDYVLQEKLSRNQASRFIKGRENVAYFVAEEQNSVLGLIGLQENQVKTFYVLPKCQGRGIGTKLLEHLLEYASKQKLKILTSKSTPEAVGFYQKHGFALVRTTRKQESDMTWTKTVKMRKIIE